MSDLKGGRAKGWDIIYSSSSKNESGSESREIDVGHKGLGSWKSSMNAISFGFVATAILISMFLIMAIFEHLFFRSNNHSSSSSSHHPRATSIQSTQMHKLNVERSSYASDLSSVVMPGEQYPRFIAQAAPLQPCPREGLICPSHTFCV